MVSSAVRFELQKRSLWLLIVDNLSNEVQGKLLCTQLHTYTYSVKIFHLNVEGCRDGTAKSKPKWSTVNY